MAEKHKTISRIRSGGQRASECAAAYDTGREILSAVFDQIR